MIGRQLKAELMVAAAALRFSALEFLDGLGVDRRWIVNATARGFLGRMNISIDRGGETYQPSEGVERRGGMAAIILPVFGGSGGGLIDLVAFDPLEPDRWFLRRGDGYFLGHRHFAE